MTATAPRFKISFDPTEHKYTLNGDPVKSVTTVLSAEGLSGSSFWKEEHRNRGTAVHQIVHLLSKYPWKRGATAEQIVNHSAWDVAQTDPALVPYGYAAANYLADSGFIPKVVETQVASLRLRLAGTLDMFGELPAGQTMIVDWKSGVPQASVWLQLNLYAALLEESMGMKTDLLTTVHLKGDGAYKAYPPKPPGGADFAVAQAAVALYHWRERNGMLG